MSSTVTLYGSLVFPPGAVDRWLAATLPVVDGDDVDGDSVFDQGNDLDSVREVLADVEDCRMFVRCVVDGDSVHIRAALADDYWSTWCGRISALATAAAGLEARGTIEAED